MSQLIRGDMFSSLKFGTVQSANPAALQDSLFFLAACGAVHGAKWLIIQFNSIYMAPNY